MKKFLKRVLAFVLLIVLWIVLGQFWPWLSEHIALGGFGALGILCLIGFLGKKARGE